MNHDLLREMLIRHEGWKKKPYPCTAGEMTIGVGWNMDDVPLPPDVASYLRMNGSITDAMVARLLVISTDTAERQARAIFQDFPKFSERRQAALADMIFNLGSTRFLKFKKTITAVKCGDWEEAARQINDSAYWRELGGDPAGTDDGKLERPEEIAAMVRQG